MAIIPGSGMNIPRRSRPSRIGPDLTEILAEMTIPEVIEEISRGALGASEAFEAEQRGRGRKTLLAALADQADR